MGVAHSNLPTIATLAMEMSVCTMMLAIWLHSTHKMSSWGIAFTLMFGWSIIVREAYGVDNPLAPLIGQDLIDAQLIYNGIYGFIALVFELLGDFICLILDIPGVLPFYACVFGNRGKNHKLWRWGRKCPPPYRHTVITFILFAAAILPAFVTYSQLMDTNRGWALGVAIVVPVVVYVITALYWWFDTDLYVFGPTSRNTRHGTKYQRGKFNNRGGMMLGVKGDNGNDQNQPEPPEETEQDQDQGDENSADDIETSDQEEPSEPRRVMKKAPMSSPIASEKEESGTRFRVIKTVLVFAVTQVLTTMILGFIRFSDNNVDTNWIAAATIGGAILLIALILAILFFFLLRRRTTPNMIIQDCDTNNMNNNYFNNKFNNNVNINPRESQTNIHEMSNNHFSGASKRLSNFFDGK